MNESLQIEVFKTNICCDEAAVSVRKHLNISYPDSKINFDLDDCDKILRIAGVKLDVDALISIVNNAGYSCVPLD